MLLLGNEWYRLEVEKPVTEVFVRTFATASTTRVIQIIEVNMQSLVQNLFAVLLSAIVWVAVLELVMASSASSQGDCLFGVG